MCEALRYETVFLLVRFARLGFRGASKSRLTGTSGPRCSPGSDDDDNDDNDKDDNGNDDDDNDYDDNDNNDDDNDNNDNDDNDDDKDDNDNDDDSDDTRRRALTDMESSGRPLSSLAASTAGSID